MGASQRTVSNINERIRAGLLNLVAIRVGDTGARGLCLGCRFRGTFRHPWHTTDETLGAV